MKCEKCSRKGNIKTTYTDRRYCDKHFMEMISRRIRKDLRISQGIDIKKEYVIAGTTPHERLIAEHFLTEIFGGRLRIREGHASENIIMPMSLDRETKEFLDEFLENKEGKQVFINPLGVVLEEEIREICRILRINYSENKNTNDIIESIDAKYPGAKFSLRKSMEEIKTKK
jgi:hypothetical protein